MRRIMVGVKRVVDYNVRIRVKPDNTGVKLRAKDELWKKLGV